MSALRQVDRLLDRKRASADQGVIGRVGAGRRTRRSQTGRGRV